MCRLFVPATPPKRLGRSWWNFVSVIYVQWGCDSAKNKFRFREKKFRDFLSRIFFSSWKATEGSRSASFYNGSVILWFTTGKLCVAVKLARHNLSQSQSLFLLFYNVHHCEITGGTICFVKRPLDPDPFMTKCLLHEIFCVLHHIPEL